MIYKLSNIATKQRIIDFTRLSFKYPHLYKPKRKINGLKEQTIPIISMENPNEITLGVWGMLPQEYDNDWNKFQQLKKTLHTNKYDIKSNIMYKNALYKRRCLLIVTGFYAHKVADGEVTTFLVEKKNQEPFYLASIYNVTSDGFITCTVINTDATKGLKSINNLYEVMPLQIPKIFKNKWLDVQTPKEEIDFIIGKPYITKFNIQEIAS